MKKEIMKMKLKKRNRKPKVIKKAFYLAGKRDYGKEVQRLLKRELVIRFRNGIKPRTADRRLCVFSFISHGICLYFFMKMLNLSKKRSFLQRINLLLSLSFIFIWFLVLHFHLLLGLLLSSIGSGITFLSFAMFSHHLFQILIFIFLKSYGYLSF